MRGGFGVEAPLKDVAINLRVVVPTKCLTKCGNQIWSATQIPLPYRHTAIFSPSHDEARARTIALHA
ncbi:hypothetical protein E2562_003926 [Oryza meyeriana var. granulata]|uniref:Uncharacterized protein n=1 Tax=Oryza meyeriana var. granulata TaxID=110450 RepID=A0A6G1CYZ4_9ORYZ|nr:hypothetical protein E2562_003926 [Oryza meyeriana var. granulata]